ncbi:MAG TPA: hypothetical protein VIG32_05305 [Candidatus Baltobacteraceae bacterium]|jgi:hypothetical protein
MLETIARKASIAIGAFVLLLLLPVSAATPPDSQIHAHVNAALEQLDRFKLTHDPADVKTALADMDTSLDLDSLTVEGFVVDRRRFAYGYAKIAAAIERSYDPNYNALDPNNVPVVPCPPPPRELRGAICPALSDIHDPKVRAEYAELLRANDDKGRRASVYLMWQRLDESAMARLESGLDLLRRVQPCTVSDDSDTLRSIFQAGGLSRQNLGRIEKVLQTPTPRGRALRLIDDAPHLAWSDCNKP